jgi:Ca-activated chloride channel homolog
MAAALMSFESPKMFVWLIAIPAVIYWYVATQRRRAARAEALAGQGLVVSPAPSGSGSGSAGRRGRGRWRHLPFAMFVLALTVLVVGLARPSATVRTPRRQGTVILALDVSNSMRATDVKPSRIAAAKADARSFVKQQPPAVRIGVVAFGDGAVVVQNPTTNHADVTAAIDHVSIGGGTSIGQGLLTSLDTIAGKQIAIDPSAINNDEGKVDVGYYGGTVIVAFTDGENTSGVDPLNVANVASAAGVRVHTVGVGTEAGTTFQYQGFTIATALDSNELQQLASLTDGTYHTAGDAGAVASVSKSISLHFTIVSQHTEITALFCAAAIALLLLGALTSVRWYGRVV